jgi:hypothetical protein
MTVPPPTDVPLTAAFGVPEGFTQTTVMLGKPNWIQDAESIAKADIHRLEGKYHDLHTTISFSMVAGIVTLVIAVWALYRTFHS